MTRRSVDAMSSARTTVVGMSPFRRSAIGRAADEAEARTMLETALRQAPHKHLAVGAADREADEAEVRTMVEAALSQAPHKHLAVSAADLEAAVASASADLNAIFASAIAARGGVPGAEDPAVSGPERPADARHDDEIDSLGAAAEPNGPASDLLDTLRKIQLRVTGDQDDAAYFDAIGQLLLRELVDQNDAPSAGAPAEREEAYRDRLAHLADLFAEMATQRFLLSPDQLRARGTPADTRHELGRIEEALKSLDLPVADTPSPPRQRRPPTGHFEL